MKVQILEDQVIGWGTVMEGIGVYDGAPDDYDLSKYTYEPAIPGVFSPDNFIPTPIEE